MWHRIDIVFGVLCAIVLAFTIARRQRKADQSASIAPAGARDVKGRGNDEGHVGH